MCIAVAKLSGHLKLKIGDFSKSKECSRIKFSRYLLIYKTWEGEYIDYSRIVSALFERCKQIWKDVSFLKGKK